MAEKIETVLLAKTDSKNEQIPEEVVKFLSCDIDIPRLNRQFSLLHDAVPDAISVHDMSLKLRSHPAKTLFTEVSHLLNIFQIIPATTANAERAFSTLKRLKDIRRNRMTQCMLNSVSVLSSHPPRVDKLNLEEILKEFICVNDRRKAFFGNP